MDKLEKRKKEWTAMSIAEKLDKEFPPRICKELSMFTFPDIQKKKDIEQSYFIWGKLGSGKTLYAASIVLEILHRQYMEGRCPDVKFTTFDDILLEIRGTYRKNNELSEQEVIDKYRQTDWLVLDDYGTNKDTDWAHQILYSIINYRYEYLKPVIVTCNYSLNEMANELNAERVASRLGAMCNVIHMKTTKRKKQ